MFWKTGHRTFLWTTNMYLSPNAKPAVILAGAHVWGWTQWWKPWNEPHEDMVFKCLLTMCTPIHRIEMIWRTLNGSMDEPIVLLRCGWLSERFRCPYTKTTNVRVFSFQRTFVFCLLHTFNASCGFMLSRCGSMPIRRRGRRFSDGKIRFWIFKFTPLDQHL